MADVTVRVDGLKALRRGLGRIDPELNKELRGKFLVIAESVASTARGKVPTRSGRAAASIRGGVSGNRAYVSGGKKSVPYYGWLDFGSRNARAGRPRSAGPWRGSGVGPTGGRFIYQAIGEHSDKIGRMAVDAMNEVAEKVLPHD